MKLKFKNSALGLLALAASLLPLAAQAQAAAPWPTQSVRIVVPFTAGTGMDTIARAVAPKLGERLGQTVVVVNQPGASGNIGADTVAKSSDGHTLLMSANTMLIAAQIYKNVPFNPLQDFAPVSMAAYGTLMLVANPKTGLKTMKEFVAQAKSRPGSISFGSPGVGTPHHMSMELFKAQTGLFLLHVPYRGTAGYTQDLLAGELNVGFLPVHIAQNFVRDGKLTALAVGSNKRHPVSPTVATFEELGVKGVEVDLWYAFFAPSKMPAATVAKLNTEIAAIIRSPEVNSLLGRAGMDATASSAEELAGIVQKDYPRWGAVIKRNGLSVE